MEGGRAGAWQQASKFTSQRRAFPAGIQDDSRDSRGNALPVPWKAVLRSKFDQFHWSRPSGSPQDFTLKQFTC